MRNFTKALPLLALLACLLCAAEARADAFAVTGGFATSGGVTGGPFTLTGDGFTLNGGFNWGPDSCSPCVAGQTVNVGSFNLGLDVRSSLSPSVFNGVTYDRIYYSVGFVRFSASLVVPDESAALFTLTTPFTFSATLQGCTNPNGPINFCPPGDIVFDNVSFLGSGIATVVLSSFETVNGRQYGIRSIRYDFAPTPTPEPATVALLSAGLAAAGAAARRRRRKAARDTTD
ncbi:MAG TPA: PEP-CTERM sorting domain-containing protein [Pyrinomonadaceae bacterium]|nr:PEP-CTERM sorting domain-containing protein [Pyrinomonadaceae bacterium]